MKITKISLDDEEESEEIELVEETESNFSETKDDDYRVKSIIDYIDRYEKQFGECSHRNETIAKNLGFGVYETTNIIKRLLKEKKIFQRVRERTDDPSKFRRVLYVSKPEKEESSFLIIPKEILELNTSAYNKILLSKMFQLYRNSIINETDKFKEFKLYSELSKEYESYGISLRTLRKSSEFFVDSGFFYLKYDEILEPTNKFTKMSYKKDFLKIPESVMCNKNIPDSKKLIYAYFMSFSNDTKKCFSKYDSIIEKLKVSRDTFYSTLREMKKLGLIKAEDYIFKNGKVGRCIEADVVQIENYYENSLIEKVDSIEVVEQATIEKVNTINNIDTVQNLIIQSRIPKEMLQNMPKEELNSIYFNIKEYLEDIKHYMNKKVDDIK